MVESETSSVLKWSFQTCVKKKPICLLTILDHFFLEHLTEEAAAVHPVWRTMAILFLVVAVLSASTCIALCVMICHSKKGLKPLKILHTIKKEGIIHLSLQQHTYISKYPFIHVPTYTVIQNLQLN